MRNLARFDFLTRHKICPMIKRKGKKEAPRPEVNLDSRTKSGVEAGSARGDFPLRGESCRQVSHSVWPKDVVNR